MASQNATGRAEASYSSSKLPIGPHPSWIQVAKTYIFEHQILRQLQLTGVSESKEDANRLQGVTLIDGTRKVLMMPFRTYNTAVVYYHKFRLRHPDGEYDHRDAAVAALFLAGKNEDTIKKSKEILCTAWNLKLPPSEHMSVDDQEIEVRSKNIIGLERLMLESSCFDFRSRHPQPLLIKLVKNCSLGMAVGELAYNICLDVYRTWAPLKQTCQTIALACLELSARVSDIDLDSITSEYGFDYERWKTTRPEVMETLLDLMDLYIQFRLLTLVGLKYPLEKFIAIRITLNQEATTNTYPRYTNWRDLPSDGGQNSAGSAANGSGPTPTDAGPQSPSDARSITERSKEGTVRFILDPSRAAAEKEIVKRYFEDARGEFEDTGVSNDDAMSIDTMKLKEEEEEEEEPQTSAGHTETPTSTRTKSLVAYKRKSPISPDAMDIDVKREPVFFGPPRPPTAGTKPEPTPTPRLANIQEFTPRVPRLPTPLNMPALGYQIRGLADGELGSVPDGVWAGVNRSRDIQTGDRVAPLHQIERYDDEYEGRRQRERDIYFAMNSHYAANRYYDAGEAYQGQGYARYRNRGNPYQEEREYREDGHRNYYDSYHSGDYYRGQGYRR